MANLAYDSVLLTQWLITDTSSLPPIPTAVLVPVATNAQLVCQPYPIHLTVSSAQPVHQSCELAYVRSPRTRLSFPT